MPQPSARHARALQSLPRHARHAARTLHMPFLSSFPKTRVTRLSLPLRLARSEGTFREHAWHVPG
eukprot:4963922-Prymnesium_polylepis.1